MQKLDRLGWADGISITAHGLRIGIRVTNADVMDDVMARLPLGWKVGKSPVVERLYSFIVGGPSKRPGVKRFNLIYGGASLAGRSRDLPDALDALELDLQLYVAEWARRKLFIHAGVVEWGGQAILIPGRSFTGKSSLVAALVKAGATYYSDEYAVIDEHGRVQPYPTPLSLRTGPEDHPEKYQVDLLGGRTGTAPVPVGAVVIAKYKQGARWRPKTLSPGRGVLALLANTVAARRKPDLAFTRLAQMIANARVIQGVRGEAEETAGALLAGVTG